MKDWLSTIKTHSSNPKAIKLSTFILINALIVYITVSMPSTALAIGVVKRSTLDDGTHIEVIQIDSMQIILMGIALVLLAFVAFISFFLADRLGSKTSDKNTKRYDAYREQARISTDNNSDGTSTNDRPSDVTSSQKISDFEKTVNGMMENNATMTRMFQENTMGDNRSSFILSAGICIVGLVLLGTIVTLAALDRIDSSVALVTGVAGAIAELGSGISLVLHQRASARTSRYFDALHENERVLYSMNMMLQISDDKARDEALSKAAVSLASGTVGNQDAGVSAPSDG